MPDPIVHLLEHHRNYTAVLTFIMEHIKRIIMLSYHLSMNKSDFSLIIRSTLGFLSG